MTSIKRTLFQHFYLTFTFIGIRQQQNQRSSFIDGSAIYGFNTAKENSLREKRGGGFNHDCMQKNEPELNPKSSEGPEKQ